ncbi:MAG: DUF4293 domain-containing protein [Bacteroidales bacterium]|nr:DUF4293 domain-containing protein [Bacteroidales bacterium]
MIQRIQSLFLFVAAAIAIALLFIPFGYITTPDAQFVFNAVSLKYNIPDGHTVVRVYYVALCLAICAVLSLIALFTYKNRIRQTQIISINMIVYLVALMLILWLCPDVIFKKFFASRGVEFTFEFAHKVLLLILVFVEALCLFLANRFIKKDEAMVRAADRLR